MSKLINIHNFPGPSAYAHQLHNQVVKIIQAQYLYPPSKKPYNFSPKVNTNGFNGQISQPQIIDKLLKGKTDGFFIEAGADDGETFSNTLFFEVKRNWAGLLVEPNSGRFQTCLSRNRKAYAINACFSLKPYPEEVDFLNAGQVSGLAAIPASKTMIKLRSQTAKELVYPGRAQCFPFFDILAAVGNPTVDLFSLDIEGAELAVLETITWNKVDIKVILVEIEHSDKNVIVRFLKKQDFVLVEEIKNQDMIFAQKGYLSSPAL